MGESPDNFANRRFISNITRQHLRVCQNFRQIYPDRPISEKRLRISAAISASNKQSASNNRNINSSLTVQALYSGLRARAWPR